ncbi:hypothetical protein PHMEG_00026880 [Phytophthora megakarya]|uniref:Uncharacterized protein n=1 Tax=Phytophthora megakarya TaxID=4795 RepID=A0A225V9C4_9STRA|nr:hypothetical protein PHMEG_00026880 [Phytophthora megakarya]
MPKMIATLEEEDGEDLNLSSEQLLSSELDDISDLLLLVQSHRYLTDRVRLPKSTEFLADTFRETTHGATFREMTRMDNTSFLRVVALIEGNPVFFNKSAYQQAPPWFQLVVALDRFGNNGTGASLNRSR